MLANDNAEDEHSQPFLPEVNRILVSTPVLIYAFKGSEANSAGGATRRRSRAAKSSSKNSELGSRGWNSEEGLQDLLNNMLRLKLCWIRAISELLCDSLLRMLVDTCREAPF